LTIITSASESRHGLGSSVSSASVMLDRKHGTDRIPFTQQGHVLEGFGFCLLCQLQFLSCWLVTSQNKQDLPYVTIT